jgi:hypothetical protein
MINWKGFGRKRLCTCPGIFPEGHGKCNDEPQVRISGVPAQIRTKQLSNSSLDRYRYARLLGRYHYQGTLRRVGLTATNISKEPPGSIFRVKNIELAGSLSRGLIRGICLEGLIKFTKILSLNSRPPRRDSPAEYKSENLPPQPTYSVLRHDGTYVPTYTASHSST